MVQADYAYIPLSSLIQQGTAASKSYLTACVGGSVNKQCDFSDQNVINCFSYLAFTCLANVPTPTINDVALPTGHFLASLSYIGVQCIVYSCIAHATLNRALRHPSWLISTIGGLIWILYSLLTFYTVNPAFPVPNQINGSLLSMLYYGGSYTKFNDFNGGSNNCQLAFNYLWGYLALNLLIVFTVVLALAIAIYAELIRYKSPNKAKYEPLAHAIVPCVLLALAVFFYLLISFSKIGSSLNALMGIANFDYTQAQAVAAGKTLWYEKVFYPFVQPSMDISTLMYIGVFTSILRGYTIQSISAFRLACASSLVFTVVSYPALVGAFQFYYYNSFNDYNTCWNYFLGAQTGFFGYPDENQAKFYCQMFRVALVGYTGLVVVMHLITVACYVTANANAHRMSEVFEPLEHTQRRLSEKAAPTSAAVGNPITHSLQSTQPLTAQRRESLDGERYSLAEVVIVGNRVSVDRGQGGLFKGSDRFEDGEHKT